MKYLYNHTSEDTAKTVSDYPWGFRLRTEQRYWVEDSKRHGQRFVTQTKNPKTGNWCKPKKSTYSAVIVMFENEKGHISFTGLSNYSANEESIKAFLEAHASNLSGFQREKCRELLAIARVMEKVEFKIVPSKVGPVDLLSTDPVEVAKRQALAEEQKEAKEKEKEVNKKINQAINYEYKKLANE